MSNQQVTQAELGWLAGIIDGEGYLGLRLHKDYRNKNAEYRMIRPEIHITNCDEEIILKTRDIAAKIGVNAYIRASKASGKVKRDSFRFQIKHLNKTIRLLKPLTEHLTGNKQKRAKLMIEFCESRLSRPFERKTEGIGKERSGAVKPYNKREIKIYSEIGPLMRRGTSETTRENLRLSSELFKIMELRADKI